MYTHQISNPSVSHTCRSHALLKIGVISALTDTLFEKHLNSSYSIPKTVVSTETKCFRNRAKWFVSLTLSSQTNHLAKVFFMIHKRSKFGYFVIIKRHQAHVS